MEDNKNIQSILEEIRTARGNAGYVLNLLDLIKGEQLCRSHGNNFNPWERRGIAIPMSETERRVGRFGEDGSLLTLSVSDIPEPLRTVLEKMEEHSFTMRTNPLGLDGELSTDYTLNLRHKGERYLLRSSHTVFLESVGLKHEKKRRGRKRGNPGNPTASMVMYILYKYIGSLGFTRRYRYVVALINACAPELFDNADIKKEFERSKERVRRRIQWVREQAKIVDYAERYEKKWFEVHQRKTVLIVEDDDTARDFLKQRLREDYRVFEASDSSEGLGILGKEVIDAVLLDMNQPIESSFKALANIKELRPDATVIVISPFGDLEIEEKCIQLGAYAYVHKPFSIEKLLDTIKRGIKEGRGSSA